MLKIIGLSIPFPGARRPLEEGAKLGLWEFILLEGERVKIPPADVYIFAAYHPIYERLFTLGGKNVILWTSSAGEMDMEPIEQQFLDRLLKDPRVSSIWFGDPSLAQAYPEKGFYAPYPLNPIEVKLIIAKQDIITLFCPAGLKKNILNQLLAVKLAQREMHLTLHTNIKGYDGIISELDCVRHDWLPEKEYRELLASAKVSLAVSWAETYSYFVAECFVLGTPCLVSPTITWMPGENLKILAVSNPNSPLEISQKILAISNMSENEYLKLRRACIDYIKVVSCRQNSQLKEALQAHGVI